MKAALTDAQVVEYAKAPCVKSATGSTPDVTDWTWEKYFHSDEPVNCPKC